MKYLVKGIICVSILGTLFHFAYQWSGSNAIVGMFTPINESIWEHTKLLFFPMLIYSVYLNRKLGKECPRIKPAMILGSLAGIGLIIALFYTYSGIIGFHVGIVDIAIFYISVISSFLVAYKMAKSCKSDKFVKILQIAHLVIIGLFIIFTFYPPGIPLFQG